MRFQVQIAKRVFAEKSIDSIDRVIDGVRARRRSRQIRKIDSHNQRGPQADVCVSFARPLYFLRGDLVGGGGNVLPVAHPINMRAAFGRDGVWTWTILGRSRGLARDRAGIVGERLVSGNRFAFFKNPQWTVAQRELPIESNAMQGNIRM